MASVFLCCSSRPAHSIKLGFHQSPSSLADSSSLNLHSTSIFRQQFIQTSFTHSNKFKNGRKSMTQKRLLLVHASNKPSEEAITSKDTSSGGGPPFLTILAGIVVFALILWVIGSIVTWVFGLFALIFSK